MVAVDRFDCSTKIFNQIEKKKIKLLLVDSFLVVITLKQKNYFLQLQYSGGCLMWSRLMLSIGQYDQFSKDSSIYVFIRLLLAHLAWPKLITLSDAYCTLMRFLFNL